MIPGTSSNPTDGLTTPSFIEEDAKAARWYCLFRLVLRGVFGLELQQVLTLLTMAIGSLALASTLFVGQGALSGLWQDLDRLVGQQVVVYPDAGPNQVLLNERPDADLTLQDLERVRAGVPDARFVEPQYFGRVYVELASLGRFMSVDGIAPRLEREEAYQPIRGRAFSQRARDGLVWECMLTQDAVKSLRLEWDEQGTIRVGDQRFQVVAVVPDPPQADQRFKARVIVPYATAQVLWGRPGVVHYIVVAWQGPEKMAPTIDALRRALDDGRAPDAYLLSSSQFRITKARSIVSNFMLVGSLQALFCIVVAAIGVVNVMLANVVRRSREFAIRVAMGARQADILCLVLAESAMLGLLGALVGTGLAVVLSGPMSRLLASRISEAAELEPSFALSGFVIPIVVCCLSSLAAGVIPTLRVRRLNLLEILRA